MQYRMRYQGASPSYPHHPGSRDNAPETSRQAANAIAPLARSHREHILAAFKAAYPESRSSDQVATEIGLSPYSVRARVSELVAAGKVQETDHRTKNQAGRTVMLWRAAL